jgi:hypothetical protein
MHLEFASRRFEYRKILHHYESATHVFCLLQDTHHGLYHTLVHWVRYASAHQVLSLSVLPDNKNRVYKDPLRVNDETSVRQVRFFASTTIVSALQELLRLVTRGDALAVMVYRGMSQMRMAYDHFIIFNSSGSPLGYVERVRIYFRSSLR